MDVIKEDNESSDTAKTSTKDANSDEIWEIIDKEDDGSVIGQKLTIICQQTSLTNIFLFHRGPEKLVSSSLCIYTISPWHTTMVANDRSAAAPIAIRTDLTIR